MIGAQKGGLGRGLAALIPTAERTEREQLKPEERVLHSLVHAGLDQLDQATSLDLLAYLHVPRYDEPTLFLRRPELGSLTPTRAYRLFARIVQAVRGGASEGTFTLDSLVAVFLRTPGAISDGIHILGRENGVLDSSALPALRTTARTFATICNQFAAGTPTDLETPRLVVELGDEGTTVHVSAPTGEGHTGAATATEAQEAVVRAVLQASNCDYTFREAREVPVENGRAVLVVLTDDKGTPHPGFVVSGEDVLQATAAATIRAIAGR
ncbi:MAG TPA: hypothetical protein VF183_14250 [Acidimicrobiales bacterium]